MANAAIALSDDSIRRLVQLVGNNLYRIYNKSSKIVFYWIYYTTNQE